LSSQYKVSCDELDFLVDLTKETPSILGARMMGGGFGGCTINLIHKKSNLDIKNIVKKYELKFKIKPSVYSIKLTNGVKII
jgi:galactokinase